MTPLEQLQKAMERIVTEMENLGCYNLAANVQLANGSHYYYNISKQEIPLL